MKPRIATLEGIYVLSDDGFYEPEPYQEETKWRLIFGLVPVSLLVAVLFGGAAYCAYRAFEALAGA